MLLSGITMSLFSRMPFDKKQIEASIIKLEQQTSAELRVYIERTMPKSDTPLSSVERALAIFSQLDMEKTEAKNAVLIYIAHKDHQCSVIGNEGIHQYVGNEFWQQQCQLMIDHFKQRDYTLGVVSAIERIGSELAKHFPIKPDDQNELPNEVIIND